MWKAGILLLFGLMAQTASAGVWEATQTWNSDADTAYATWVKENWKKEFFLTEGTPYTGLRLDCADAVLAMRIIFAFEHGYPVRFRDPTGGKRDITEKMARWDKIPAEKRIRKFLQYVFSVMGTVNLPDNSYPIAINRESVRAGVLLLANKETHHAWTIKDVSETGVPYLIHSRRPKRTVLLTQRSFPSNEFLLKGVLTAESHAGYRAFRRPEDVRKAAWKIAGYSEEQYSFPIEGWSRTIQRKLELERETPEQELERLLLAACETAEGRALEVKMGVEYLAKKRADYCYTAQEFDDYSTPSYDYRLRQSFKELRKSYLEITNKRNYTITGQLAADVASVLNLVEEEGAAVTYSDTPYCPIEYAPGKTLSLGEIRSRALTLVLSSNPHDPIEYRWGEKRGHSKRASTCPTY